MGSIEAKQHRAVNVMMRESLEKPKGISAGRAYEIAINHLDDHDLAIELLTSDRCGYSTYEINIVMYQKNYYQSHKASNQVNAF